VKRGRSNVAASSVTRSSADGAVAFHEPHGLPKPRAIERIPQRTRVREARLLSLSVIVFAAALHRAWSSGDIPPAASLRHQQQLIIAVI